MKPTKNQGVFPHTTERIGRIPPQALELEEAVLGALMSEKDTIRRISLRISDFYSQQNADIFAAISRLSDTNKPVDIFTVSEQLRQSGTLESCGNVAHIAEIYSKVSSAAYLEYHAAILHQKAIARQLIELTSRVEAQAYDENQDIADTMEELEKGLTDISTLSNGTKAYTLSDSMCTTLDYMQTIQRNVQQGINPGIPTGLSELDKALNGGWNAPDLIVLGGRPSMGKTQFACHFARCAAETGKNVLFVSIEMTKIQLCLRLLTASDGIDYYRIRTGQLTTDEWRLVDIAEAELDKLPLSIADDSNVRDLTNIRSLARLAKRKGKLDMLIIDYLQLVKTEMKFGTRDLEVGYITGELKNLAKELGIPVLLLAQLNRPMKGTKVSTPKLEDLRESGNIEQDADIVLFPHRPSYYDENVIESGTGEPWNNRGFIVIGKSREGQRDLRIKFRHDDKFKRIWGEDEHAKPQVVPTIPPYRNFYELEKDEPF